MSTLAANDDKDTSPELRVGDWRVDATRNELSRGSESVKLEPKVIEVLMHLARRAGRVVGREELLSAVWPGVVVGDDALTQAIIKLRKAFGDDAHRPKYIETISKRGYRLIAPVEEGGKAVADARARLSFVRRNRVALAAAAGILLVSVGALLLFPEIAKTVGMPWPIALDEKGGLPRPSRPIVAVLPLSNQSGDPKRDYFSDGVTEDIINALGRYSGVRVISRNSVEAYKSRPADPQAIRKDLGARYLVKGSVREAEGKLRVAVELSDTEKGMVLWSDRHEGVGKDVFEIQDRIVRNIVGALAVKVTRLEIDRAAAKAPENLEAYDMVLRARALLDRSDRASNRQARALLATALDKAPHYADVYVLLGQAENTRAIFGWMEDPAEGMARAEQYARRALAIDDPGAHARAYGLLGTIYVTARKFDQALEAVDRAIELNPSDATAYEWRGATLLFLGRIEEALAALETGLLFNPGGRGAGGVFNRVTACYLLQRYPEAVAIADAGLARFTDAPSFILAMRAASLAQMGKAEEAKEGAAQVRRVDPFFRAAQFGDRFVDPKYTAHIQEGLRKAGL